MKNFSLLYPSKGFRDITSEELFAAKANAPHLFSRTNNHVSKWILAEEVKEVKEVRAVKVAKEAKHLHLNAPLNHDHPEQESSFQSDVSIVF